MAVTQPLKGGSNKIYSVINNFNKGIDRNTADDVASDASFKELVNFCNANDGTLSKRPGVYDSYLTDFIGAIVNGNYSKEGSYQFVIKQNRFMEGVETTLNKLSEVYNSIFADINDIIGFQITSNNKFFELLQNYEILLEGDTVNAMPKASDFSCIIIKRTNSFYSIGRGLEIVRLAFTLETGIFNANLGIHENRCQIEVDYVNGDMASYKNENGFSDGQRWAISNKISHLDLASYNGYTYIPTGLNYLIKIDQNPENNNTKTSYPGEPEMFQVIGGDDDENLYKPTPIELNRVGFNILANNPLSLYDISGTVGKVRGVFYTVRKEVNGELIEQPVQQIPYNSKFYIHILFTGSSVVPSSIKYRPNNEKTDVEKNPYKTLPGSYISDVAPCIFECSGIDATDNFEIQIILGEDEFLSYISTGSVIIPETGLINEVNDLVLSSTRLKVINSQLMLYGGHGYLFFSDFDIFNYFPNFYNIYVANESLNETVVSVNYFRQYYAVFTDRRIKKLTGSTTDDFAVAPLNDFVGCANGFTVNAIGNNLYFLGNDGIYRLKQGYLGEGTENVEKIDYVLDNELNLSNVSQAFVLGSNYIVTKTDGITWIIYNVENEAFYEYILESEETPNYYANKVNYQPFFGDVFKTSLYDRLGDFVIVPTTTSLENVIINEYGEEKIEYIDKTSFRIFRLSDIDYISDDKQYKDGYGFISTLETHDLHMGYPTNTKKFKDIYIKMLNNSGHAIPLYVTIYVDDRVVISPENYVIKHDIASNTFYYVKETESNEQLDISKVLGEFTLGEDVLGNKVIQQIKFRIADSGRSIKIKLSDGYNDTSSLDLDAGGVPERKRNIYNFSILSIGIVYKVKKVKEG